MIQDASSQKPTFCTCALQTGDYDIYCNSHITVNNEHENCLDVTLPIAFRHGVRECDGKCVMMGIVNRRAPHGTWSSFEAAHIFPLEKESWWDEHNYERWIEDVTPGVDKTNSRQNGLLLQALDPVCRNPTDPHRVCDELLRWHYRQSVLANMRGAGEPIFEHDFPPGTDMIREIS
ncbi:hypothetical protein EX30DRAFT_100153 [Ascodesmis nigricans]|uniref:HNH nuclease domain-containing protein n=1 Tax=Ascodesmis nigricans TaxID=341454 RepID=A0A4S2N4U6_9PEZI|nr:hypothetical protein EX30DRAFT_100153 [Ascodesmis nigricans]